MSVTLFFCFTPAEFLLLFEFPLRFLSFINMFNNLFYGQTIFCTHRTHAGERGELEHSHKNVVTQRNPSLVGIRHLTHRFAPRKSRQIDLAFLENLFFYIQRGLITVGRLKVKRLQSFHFFPPHVDCIYLSWMCKPFLWGFSFGIALHVKK